MTLESDNLSALLANLTRTSRTNQSELLSMTDSNNLTSSPAVWIQTNTILSRPVTICHFAFSKVRFICFPLWFFVMLRRCSSSRNWDTTCGCNNSWRTRPDEKKTTDHFDAVVCGCVSAKESRSPFEQHRIRSAALPLPEAEVGGWTLWLLVIISFSWCSFNQCSSSVWGREENKMKGGI